MQTVPSLIGTGTAVAAAAVGLVFGQSADEPGEVQPNSSTSSTSSTFRPAHDRGFDSRLPQGPRRPRTSTLPPTGSGTRNSGAHTQPRDSGDFDTYFSSPPAASQKSSPPSASSGRQRSIRRSPQTQVTPSKSATLRSSARQHDFLLNTTIAEDGRDSISSNGSWMRRRLSIRPLSHHGSIRSSTGADSPSIFSFGSGAPILESHGHQPSHLPPNKLVKRASTNNGGDAGPLVRRGSRSQMTLRRPATSHQRSATLQQMNIESLPPLPKFSMDQARPRVQPLSDTPPPVSKPINNGSSRWQSFWHLRLSRAASRSSPLRPSDGSAPPSAKRICIEQGAAHTAYLMAPSTMVGGSAPEAVVRETDEAHGGIHASPESDKSTRDVPDATPSRQPRRSISANFSSPSNWISKTGSLRRRKRGDTAIGGEKRNVSAPVKEEKSSVQIGDGSGQDEPHQKRTHSRAESDLAAIFQPPSHAKAQPSPLPPLSRLSSFHVDLNQLASGSDSQAQVFAPVRKSPQSQRAASGASQGRAFERASTVASSDYHRDVASGDDDTDTPYDSLRTVASGHRRAPDSPLESMFDESPPSTAGNNKPKRLSIQEILGPTFDGGNKIMEEDENLTTPVRRTHANIDPHTRSASDSDDVLAFGSTSPQFTFTRDSRVSFDDDDDLDWTREDESHIFNQLSPPSSMNSRRGSPSLRMALFNISGNSTFDPNHDTTSERPRSNIFDWVEPPYLDKSDSDRDSRPKTVHGKKELDLRGGRSASRKVPTAAHVRSQSVPVVPDASETTKSAPKFGTWGLGTKNVSEDWDDDFDFDEDPKQETAAGKKADRHISMLVPASIQATQPTVRAHSGQIRELSHLVNNLKKLCRLGKEMNLLHGPSAALWREAEAIIALASPDEDTAEDGEPKGSGQGSGAESDEHCLSQGLDGASPETTSRLSSDREKQDTGNRSSLSPGRRQSVFSPEDDIFGNWDQQLEPSVPQRPSTPEKLVNIEYDTDNGAFPNVDSPQPGHSRSSTPESAHGSVHAKLNFDTNSLKDLVKQASDLRDVLSDLVRKTECITQSPARTPRRERHDGSPAFTRVFDDPALTPSKRLPPSRSNKPSLKDSSAATSPSSGLSQRMQMMTVS